MQPGVDWVFYGNEERIEYDVRIAPGADIRDLRLELSGRQRLRMDAEENLLVLTNGNEIRRRAPDGERRRVNGEYEIEANGSVGFVARPPRSGREAVVDSSPSIAYSTFLGATGTDSATSMAIDSHGKIYIGRTTTS